MRTKRVPAWACVLALLGASSLRAQTAADAEVARGVKQVEEGDYDSAIFTLDVAARRLAGDPSRLAELAQAYLHLGIAYVGKGHEAAARAKFREALRHGQGLSLSAERFPPKVIDLFEAAREDARREASPAATAAPASAVPRKSGGSKALIVVGAVAAAGGGVALAVGGGGDAAEPSGPGASGGRRTQTFGGTIASEENLNFPIAVGGTGVLEAKISWGNLEAALAADLHVPGSIVASSNRTAPGNASLTTNVGPQTYSLQLLHRGGCASASASSASPRRTAMPCSTPFTLQVIHP